MKLATNPVSNRHSHHLVALGLGRTMPWSTERPGASGARPLRSGTDKTCLSRFWSILPACGTWAPPAPGCSQAGQTKLVCPHAGRVNTEAGQTKFVCPASVVHTPRMRHQSGT